MPVSFLPSLRSRQMRGLNFAGLNSPDSGVPGPAYVPPPVPAAAEAPAAQAAPASLTGQPFQRQDSVGGEGYGGGGNDPNTSGYGQTTSWGGFLGGLLSPALSGLAMISNPNATSVNDALFGGKPTSLASMVTDAFDPNVVDPNIAAPGKGGAIDGGAKADYGADFSGAVGTGPGKGDPGADPGLEGGTMGESKGETPAEGGAKGDAPGGGGHEGGHGGSDFGFRTGGAIPGDARPGLSPVPAVLHENEFVLRPEIAQAIGPELLTAVNSGVIPPEILAEAIMVLLEQFDPDYTDGPMPIAGPDGTMRQDGGMPMPAEAPGFRSGGAVRPQARPPWREDYETGPLEPKDAIRPLRSGRPAYVVEAGMPMRQRTSAIRQMQSRPVPEDAPKQRAPVPPYRPQHPEMPTYRDGGSVGPPRQVRYGKRVPSGRAVVGMQEIHSAIRGGR